MNHQKKYDIYETDLALNDISLEFYSSQIDSKGFEFLLPLVSQGHYTESGGLQVLHHRFCDLFQFKTNKAKPKRNQNP